MQTEPTTVCGLFLNTLERFPERTFIRRAMPDGSIEELSYTDVSRHLAEIVVRLRELGVTRDEHVACYAEAMEPSIYFGLSCAFIGAAPLFISPLQTEEMFESIINRLHAKATFAHPAEAAERLRKRGLAPITFASSGTTGATELPWKPKLSASEAKAILTEAAKQVTEDTFYVFATSSGSTGMPKLMKRTNKAAVYNGTSTSEFFGFRADESPPHRILMVASLTHGVGHHYMMMGIHLGAELCVTTGLDVGATLKDVRALDPTFLPMSPRVLRAFHAQYQELGGEKMFGPRAQVVVVAGAPPDPEILKLLERQGVDPVDLYGAAETGIICATPRGKWREGYIGVLFKNVEHRFDDGELMAKNAGGMHHGYFEDPESTRATFSPDGFARLGDYIEITDDGYLRYVGRKKDVFNTMDGSNIPPGPIEATIEGLPWVKQIVLIGDRRPFIAALIVIDGQQSSEPDGYLPPGKHADLYERAVQALATINRGLQFNEKVRRVALFAKPLPEELYRISPGGLKFLRRRTDIEAAYRPHLDAIYAADYDARARVEDAP